MTDLLPRESAVSLELFDESAEVPDGKVWVLSVSCTNVGGNSTVEVNGRGILSFNTTESDSSMSKLTLHEGDTIAGNDRIIAHGWEFDYSE